MYADLQNAVEKLQFKIAVPSLSNPSGPGFILIADKIELIPYTEYRYGTSNNFMFKGSL